MPIKILLVDDDAAMRWSCRRSIEAAGGASDLAFEEASSGEEAIALMRAHRFDCVLSDHRMGIASGLDVLRFAAHQCPEAVRILLTGFAAPELEEVALTHARVHGFFEKPMTPTELDTLLHDKLVDPYLRPLASQRAGAADGAQSTAVTRPVSLS